MPVDGFLGASLFHQSSIGAGYTLYLLPAKGCRCYPLRKA